MRVYQFTIIDLEGRRHHFVYTATSPQRAIEKGRMLVDPPDLDHQGWHVTEYGEWRDDKYPVHFSHWWQRLHWWFYLQFGF